MVYTVLACLTIGLSPLFNFNMKQVVPFLGINFISTVNGPAFEYSVKLGSGLLLVCDFCPLLHSNSPGSTNLL